MRPRTRPGGPPALPMRCDSGSVQAPSCAHGCSNRGAAGPRSLRRLRARPRWDEETMAWVRGTRGVLLDVDGTLLLGDAAAPGAALVLTRLRDAGISFCITTNTTRKPRAAV